MARAFTASEQLKSRIAEPYVLTELLVKSAIAHCTDHLPAFESDLVNSI